jgi:DNA-binding NarL/FixJ family response regulator
MIHNAPAIKILLVDDHDMVLSGTQQALQQTYPQNEIVMFKTADAVLNQSDLAQFNLVVLDLSMPNEVGAPAQTETGLNLLSQLMQRYPRLNIMVQSTHVRSLIRLMPSIQTHGGGFAVADKSLSMSEILSRIDLALQGLTCTPKEMRQGLEFKPEWLELLHLAFHDGLQDQAIAHRMNIALRTVRNYWSKIQDVLEVYDDQKKQINIRIQTEIRAREMGLID